MLASNSRGGEQLMPALPGSRHPPKWNPTCAASAAARLYRLRRASGQSTTTLSPQASCVAATRHITA